MRIIGVIDVLAEQVVAARAGQRDQYRPINTPLCDGSAPADIANAFANQLGIDEFYLADLDRLAGRAPNLNAWQDIAQTIQANANVPVKKVDFANTNAGDPLPASSPGLWLDVGLRDANDIAVIAQQLGSHAALADTKLICASETWHPAPSQIDPPDHRRLAFGLDLRHGQVSSPIAAWQETAPLELARARIDAGWNRFVVLDVTAVGTGAGCPTLELCQQLRHISDDIEIITGGGIRDQSDLRRLAETGCNAALLSTALHQGSISLQ